MSRDLRGDVKTYLKIFKLIQSRRNGIRPTEIIEALGIAHRRLYRYLTIIAEIEPLYTERRGKYVYYKLLRGDE